MISPGNYPLTIVRGTEFSGVIFQFKDDGVIVTGTLSPDVTGTYIPCGTFAAYPLFILSGSPSTFIYFNTVAASYVIARLLTNAALTDYWSPAVALTEPTGTYVAHGANTGTATATDNPVDLTGYAAEAVVRRSPQSEVYIDLLPSITDAVNGEVTIPPILTANTNLLQFTGVFNWDLILIKTAQRHGPYIKGSFTVSDNITQDT